MSVTHPHIFIKNASIKELYLEEHSHKIKLKGKLGTKNVSVNAQLKEELSNDLLDKLIHELFLLALTHTENNYILQVEDNTEIKQVFQDSYQKYRENSALQKQIEQNYFQTHKIQNLNTSELITKLDVKVDPETFLEKIAIFIAKIWRAFVRLLIGCPKASTLPKIDELDAKKEEIKKVLPVTVENLKKLEESVDPEKQVENFAGPTSHAEQDLEENETISDSSSCYHSCSPTEVDSDDEHLNRLGDIPEFSSSIASLDEIKEKNLSEIEDIDLKNLYAVVLDLSNAFLKALFEDERSPLQNEAKYKEQYPLLAQILHTACKAKVSINAASNAAYRQVSSIAERRSKEENGQPLPQENFHRLIEMSSFKEVLEPLKSIVESLNQPTETNLKDLISKTIQEAGQHLALHLGYHLIQQLDKINHTYLLDTLAASFKDHAAGIYQALVELKKAPSDDWRKETLSADFLNEKLSNYFPTEALHKNLENIKKLVLQDSGSAQETILDINIHLIQTAENLTLSVFPQEKITELAKEFLKAFETILAKNISNYVAEDKKEPVNADITKLIQEIGALLQETFVLFDFPINEAHSEGESSLSISNDLSIDLNPLDTFLISYIREILGQKLQENIQTTFDQLAQPLYLKNLFQESMLPAINSSLLNLQIEPLLKNAPEKLEQLEEILNQDQNSEEINNDLENSFIQNLKENLFKELSPTLKNPEKIEAEIEEEIKVVLNHLKTLKEQEPEKRSKELIESFFEAKRNELNKECEKNPVYWELIQEMVFNIGGFLNENPIWKLSFFLPANILSFSKKQIALLFSNSLNDLRSSHHLLFDSTAKGLSSLKEEMGNIAFKETPDLEEKKDEIMQNLDDEILTLAYLLEKFLYSYLYLPNITSNLTSKVSPVTKETIHDAVQKMLKIFFSSEKLNKSLYLTLLDDVASEFSSTKESFSKTELTT